MKALHEAEGGSGREEYTTVHACKSASLSPILQGENMYQILIIIITSVVCRSHFTSLWRLHNVLATAVYVAVTTGERDRTKP